MEDDGMLLNFAPAGGLESAARSAKVSGGNWRDRRKLQLSLLGRTKERATGVNNIDVAESRVNPQRREHIAGAKRKDKTQSAPLGLSTKRIKFAESNGEFGGKNNSYVSSLFTSNESTSLQATDASQNKTYLPSNAPLKDATTFDGLGLNDKLSTHLTEHLRFLNPTKVQRAVIPSLLATQNDLFVKAQTGSGKTLAFLLPIFHKLMCENTHKIGRESGLFAIILTPTRELATQIYGVMETLTRCYHHIVPGIVIGGEKKKSEKARLRKGVNILVATPGRLADHIENTSSFNVSQLRWLVLDEGDRLVELGFEETITKITDHISKNSDISSTLHKWQGLPSKRVNVLCSATLQKDVKKLGSVVLHDPEMISVDTKEGTVDFDIDTSKSMAAPDQLVQQVVVVPPKLRLVTMAALLRTLTSVSTESHRTIIFFSCADSVDFHFDVLSRTGRKVKRAKKEGSEEQEPGQEHDEDADYSVLTAPLLGNNVVVYKLHGSLTQQVRTSTLQAFVRPDDTPRHSILLCTDVASRGLDLPNISNVVEFDPPFSVEDHLHRIGRSARVGKAGSATLFLLPGNEEGYVDGKIKVVHPGSIRILKYDDMLKDGFAEYDTEEEGKKKPAKVDPKKKDGKWDVHATTWHLEVERWLLEDTAANSKAVQAFTSHIRAYATHLSAERQFFNVKLLHLGHLAKSFGLRETPKKLGKSVGLTFENSEGSGGKKKKEDPRKKMLRMAKLAAKSNSDEFNY